LGRLKIRQFLRCKWGGTRRKRRELFSAVNKGSAHSSFREREIPWEGGGRRFEERRYRKKSLGCI